MSALNRTFSRSSGMNGIAAELSADLLMPLSRPRS